MAININPNSVESVEAAEQEVRGRMRTRLERCTDEHGEPGWRAGPDGVCHVGVDAKRAAADDLAAIRKECTQDLDEVHKARRNVNMRRTRVGAGRSAKSSNGRRNAKK